MGLCVVLVGNIVDGFRVFGPFKTTDHALEWTESAGGLMDWAIAPLESKEAL
jgi:hypothetical protein